MTILTKDNIIEYMTTITIPKKITGGTDLVILPREEYEQLLDRQIPEFVPTAQEKRDIARARKNRAKGNYMTVDELKRKLGFAS